MDTNTVLLIINTILTALNPVLSSFSYLIKHISQSKCCGNELLIRRDSHDRSIKNIKKTIEEV